MSGVDKARRTIRRVSTLGIWGQYVLGHAFARYHRQSLMSKLKAGMKTEVGTILGMDT